jgi:uncharacterized SAM-binding protein YcdF (DUF218 family)
MSSLVETINESKGLSASASEPASVPKRRGFLIRALRWLLFGIAILFLVYVFRAQLLTQFAKMWIVDEPLQRADVIVVLGGGLSSRPVEAARLYHQGYASQLLVMVSGSGSAETNEDGTPVMIADKQALLRNGVPETAVVTIGQRVSSTYEEAQAVHKWAATSGVKRVIIPSDMFHTRRMHWIFQKTLKPLDVNVMVSSIPAKAYSTSNWWKSEDGLLTFNNEIIKLIYYRLNY